MDPGTLALMLTALKFVGEEAAKAGVGEAAKGAMHKFAGLVRAKLKGRPLGEQVLDQYVRDPETWKAPMRKELLESGAVNDPEIATAAQQVVTLIGKQNIALGKNVVQAERTGDVFQIDQVHVGQHAEGISDFFMSLNTYREVLRPDLERDFEIKFPGEDRLLTFLHRGWEEVYITHQGRRKRVVIGEHGRVDNVPVIRPKLSEATKRLLVASYRVTDGRFAQAIKWHKREGTLTISGETATGAEGRASYQELMDNDLAEHESEAILRLTSKGAARARELAEQEPPTQRWTGPV